MTNSLVRNKQILFVSYYREKARGASLRLMPGPGFIEKIYQTTPYRVLPHFGGRRLLDELGHLRHILLDVLIEGFLSLLGRLGQLDARTHHFRQPFVLLGIELQ